MNNIASTPADDRQLRLVRLLGFLDNDRCNAHLMADALALAVELRHFSSAASIAALAAALEQRPPALTANLCLYHLNVGQATLALSAGREAREAGLRTAIANVNTAWAAFRCGEYAEAVALIEEVSTNAHECDAGTNLLCARAMHQLGEIERAYRRLPAPGGNCTVPAALLAEYLGLRALIAVDMGDGEIALIDARTALAHNPLQADALLALGDALKELGEFSGAELAYQTLTAERPDTGRAWSGLAQVHFSGLRFGDAEQCARRATECMGNHIGTWHVLGWALLMRGDHDGAREAFTASLPLQRGFADTHGALAAVAFMAGHQDEALRQLKIAERLDGNSAAVQFARFLQLLEQQDVASAQDFLVATLNRKAPGADAALRHLVEAHARDLMSRRSTP